MGLFDVFQHTGHVGFFVSPNRGKVYHAQLPRGKGVADIGLFQPFQARLQNQQVQSRNRATALSLHAMILDCVAIATNLAFGALAQRSLPLAFGFGAAASLAALALLRYWRRRTQLV